MKSATLYLDTGTHLGWAIRRHSGAIESDTQDFSPLGKEGFGVRFVRFRAWLHSLKFRLELLDEEIAEIVYEGVGGARWRSADAAAIVLGMRATLETWAEHHKIPYRAIAPGDIKKGMTGRGDAKKPAIIAAVRARGFTPIDDNEADALALLLISAPAEAQAA